MTFRRRQRLGRDRDFERIMGVGCKVVGPHLLVFVAANGLPTCRLGLRVGRRLGIAVRRNRIKRLIREAFRRRQHDLPAGLDVVCLPRTQALADLDLAQVGEELLEQVRRAAERLSRQTKPKSEK